MKTKWKKKTKQRKNAEMKSCSWKLVSQLLALPPAYSWFRLLDSDSLVLLDKLHKSKTWHEKKKSLFLGTNKFLFFILKENRLNWGGDVAQWLEWLPDKEEAPGLSFSTKQEWAGRPVPVTPILRRDRQEGGGSDVWSFFFFFNQLHGWILS